MISKTAEQFCSGPLSDIENYEEAVKSKNNYHIHHRLETSKNLSRQYLIDHGLYYNRPPEELIFLESSTHNYLHQLCKKGHSEEEAYEIINLNRKLTPEIAYNMHYNEKLSIRDISITYNTTDKTVWRRITSYYKNNLPENPDMSIGEALVDISPEKIYKLYHEYGMTIDDIAKSYKISRRTVQKRLDRYLEEHPIEKPGKIPFFEFDPLALTSPEELFDWYIIRKYDLERISYNLNLDEQNIKKLLDLWNITDPMNWSNPHWWKAPKALYKVSPDPVKIERPDFSWMKIKKF